MSQHGFGLNWLLLLLFLPLSAMNGYSQIGWGIKSKGMGGVGVAYPQEAFVIAHNPAGMPCVGTRVDLLAECIHSHAVCHERSINGPFFDDTYTTTDDRARPSLAATWEYCPCTSLGLAAYRLGGTSVDYGQPLTQLDALQVDPAAFPTQTNTGSDLEVYMISPAWGWRINRWHSIGISLNVGLSWLSFCGLQPLATVENSVAPDHVTDQGTDFALGAGLTVGWMGQLLDCVWVGFSYRSKTWMGHMRDYRGLLAEHGRFDLPAQWGFGFTYKPSSCFAIVGDLTRIMWADTKTWRNDQFRTGLYGSDDSRAFGWKDQWAAKVGFSWDVLPCLTLRGGWNYGDIQAGGPETLVNAINQAVIEHHFTGGLTYSWRCFELNASYVHALYHNVAYFRSAENRWDKLKSEQKVFGIGLAWRL